MWFADTATGRPRNPERAVFLGGLPDCGARPRGAAPPLDPLKRPALRTHHPARLRPPAKLPAYRRRRSLGAVMLAVSVLMGWGALSAHVSAAQVGFSATGRLPGLGSGKIWSVAIHPSLPSTILAGTDAGVYVSRDTGATWIRTLGGIRVWTVGFDARTPSNAFAGTDGKGVYASSDAGATWTNASSGLGNL